MYIYSNITMRFPNDDLSSTWTPCNEDTFSAGIQYHQELHQGSGERQGCSIRPLLRERPHLSLGIQVGNNIDYKCGD